jgi:hypothetical protein
MSFHQPVTQHAERDFLLLVLRNFVAGKPAPEIPDGLNWNRLDMMIAADNLMPLFSHLYAKSPRVPGADRPGRWQRTLMGVLHHNLRALKTTVELVRILREENIPAVVLRGLALAHTVYPEPYLRPMRDVDLLVPADIHGEIVGRLEKHGLKPVQSLRGQFVYVINETSIEIHWSFLTAKRYQQAADFGEWIRAGRPFRTPEGELPGLSPEHELLDLVCHAFIHHELDSLQPLVDIGLFVRRNPLDWSYLADWCRRASMLRLFRLTMAFADHLLELGLAEPIAALDAPLPRDADRAFEAYEGWLFGEDSRSRLLCRKRNMLFAAERPLVWWMQFFRFFRRDEFLKFARLTPNDRHRNG